MFMLDASFCSDSYLTGLYSLYKNYGVLDCYLLWSILILSMLICAALFTLFMVLYYWLALYSWAGLYSCCRSWNSLISGTGLLWSRVGLEFLVLSIVYLCGNS